MAMARPWHIALSFALLMAAWPGSVNAGSLRKVWELDLKKIVHEKGARHASDLKVRKLKFSPDGRQIAVGMFGPRTIVVQARNPDSSPKEFPISPFYNDLDWSPDGSLLLVERSIVHLEDGRTCKLPDRLVTPRFISNDRIIAELSDNQDNALNRTVTHIKYYNINCKEQDTWDVKPTWFIRGDISDHSSILVGIAPFGPSGTTSMATLIVDPFSKTVLRQWSGAGSPSGWFADRGNAICGSSACWDSETGRRISAAPVGIHGADYAVATSGSRIVVDNFDRMDTPYFSKFRELGARRVVWDFRTGREVVSWRPKFVTYSQNLLDFTQTRNPYPCAISPDGEYIAEGGEGKIWLYKIEP